jgi:signal transduction histidine kinase
MGAALLHQQLGNVGATAQIVERMRTSSRRMSRMIEQILDLTRSRLAGGLQINPAAMDLCDTLVGIIEEMRVAHPDRVIDFRCAPLMGTWDRDRLEQVFSNLVGNALQHGSGHMPVRVEGRANGTAVVIEVHNDGNSIPEELRANIFNPFRRGERDSRTKRTEGLGLGLYISREIVLAHGGDITVHSSTTEGTTFRVSLPTTTHPPRCQPG